MSERNEQLQKITLPKDAWAALSDEDQYAISVLGHIFNEVMILQRLMHAVQPRKHRTKVEVSGSVCQVLFLYRLFLAKIFEANERINKSKEVVAFLKTRCFPHMPPGEGEALLKTFRRAASQCKWLSQARNGHSMHYPAKAELDGALQHVRKLKAPFVFIMGSRAGDMLYETPDQIANLAFCMEAGEGDWKAGMEAVAGDANSLADKLNDLIRLSLNAFFETYQDDRLPSATRLKVKTAKSFSTPHLADFEIPYFFDLR
ncbi:hypothetical protein [Paraburkholderia phenoliruptrix]|uniref:hypothetical protein n=1 Tax=Paraburkholderia phenoliruptrix TaxID=252970 RepID=UPI001C501505|nr:hypothetical protein [Paraburkholderia phenoliruptrix]MBW0450822.1 hypothetical protein [Paraburkholderia phenoliruptrix]MBW9100915.1 hypothetical protein [Paraburkholderia phenoliruptrix]